MEHVRVRFAPSPTGFFHIGSARTALFNWLYARHTGGTFVLRIEDTDKERSKEEFLNVIYDAMRWLGMDWDEGPQKDGEYGPYFQSERSELYREYLEKLREKGRIYEAEGATWFKISGEPQVIDDKVRGRVERTEEKDFVIFRSDGSPVFHFTNVVDDLTMKITHVIRGEDHLSNTSKHTELFRAFGVEPPVYAHIPLILKDPSLGKGKMSKRDRGALIEEYQNRHYLPEAVRNFLVLLGWNPKDNSEIMPIDEIIERFDLPGINRDNSRFDEKKLAHINTEYVRNLPHSTFAWLARPLLAEAGVVDDSVDESYLQEVLSVAQEKVRDLEGLPELVQYFFTEDYPSDPKAEKKIAGKPDYAEKARQVLETLEPVQPWDETEISAAFDKLAAAHGSDKPFPWFPTTRFALSGQSGGPDLIPMLKAMRKDRVIARLQRAAG